MNENTQNVIETFNKLVNEYPLIQAYFSVGTTLKFVESEDGFDVIINDNKIFHVGLWELDQLRTYVYCSVCILREIWLEHVTVSAD